MEGNRRIFGYMPDGTPVEEIGLRYEAFTGGLECTDERYAEREISCKIITYGGAIRSLAIPDWAGEPVDVVLGFDTLEGYMAQDKYMGAIVGRYANRIAGARFTLDGKDYQLAANDGENSLHGGDVGFDKQVWTVEELSESAVTLSLVSPDMQEGYPGTLEVRVTYSLDSCGLAIDYWARSDKDTVCNLTNHSYFDLSGHDKGPITGHAFKLRASRYTPARPGSIPTGELAPVDRTPMDLRVARVIDGMIDREFDQLTMAGGYDHNWVADSWNGVDCCLIGGAWSRETGIDMSVYTTEPGVQFYTGNYLEGCPVGKGGAVYGRRHGFCLETQHFPDSPNQPGFPSCVLKAGEEFTSRTRYDFSITEDEAY